MFDVLTYQKGGALLRMLEQYLGPAEFRTGVSHYLRTHAYANTETNDLWDAIEATSGEPVRRLMDSWIWQPGFPLVSAALIDLEGGQRLRLRQERFSYGDADSGSNWVIPVHVRSGGETQTIVIDSNAPVTLPLPSPDDVVVVNAGGHGFFRVAYGPELRARLANPLALTGLDTLERYSLVDDAWAATVAGRMPAADLLVLLEGFVDEREHGVWQAVTIALVGLSRLVDDAALDAFQNRVRDLVAPALGSLGDPSPDESDLTGKLRGLLTRTMGSLGRDAATRTRCRELFTAARSGESVDAELLAAATNVVAATGDNDDYEQMLDGFTCAATPQEQLRHLYTLAEFDDDELVARTCELAMSDAVKTQNAPYLLRSTIANRRHGAASWEFVKARWAEANERFPANTIVRMVDAVKLLTTPGAVDDAARFFAEHPIEQAAQTLEQILERQRVNAALQTREQEAFATFLLDAQGEPA
jgi:puromycin-sensitive aminopeptidase